MPQTSHGEKRMTKTKIQELKFEHQKKYKREFIQKILLVLTGLYT